MAATPDGRAERLGRDGRAQRAWWRLDRDGRRARWELVRLCWRASPPATAVSTACVAVLALLPAAFAVVSGVAVGAVPAAVRDGLDSAAGRRLLVGVTVVGTLFVVQQALAIVSDALFLRLSRLLRGQTYRRSMAATLRPSTVAHLDEPDLQDTVAAATTLGPVGPGAAVQSLFSQWRRLLGAGSSLVLVVGFRWWLALLLLVTELRLLHRNRAGYNQLIAFRVRHLPELRRAVYYRGLAMLPDAAKETRVFGLGAWVVNRYRASWLTAMGEIWARRRGLFPSFLGGAAPVVAVHGLAYWLLGRAAIEGDIGIGALVTYAQAVGRTVAMCLAGDDIAVEEGLAVVRATGELEAAADHDPRLQLPGRGPVGDLPRREVRFEAVTFRYPGQPADVLRQLDLTIPVGHSLAVVGDNGAGKTTLVKLLARLYDPTAGRVTADGVDLRQLSPAGWQRQVAAVFQDFVRYPGTAADNVGFGAPAHLSDRAGLEDAARRAGAAALVQGLPRSWDTVLSREFEHGVELSGGEWQRIALARALLAVANGARLLVLDEPTAHLDARAEADFFDRFLDVTSGCTTVVISHRFSTVRRADRIVVLDRGRISESGTHDELIARGGRYARMFALQASRFHASGPWLMPERLRALRLVVRHVFRADPLRAWSTLVLAVVTQVVEMFGALLLRTLVDGATSGDGGAVVRAALLLAGTLVLSLVGTWASIAVGMSLRERSTLHFDVRMAELCCAIPYLDHHERADYLDELELLHRNHQQLASVHDALLVNGATVVRLTTAVVLLATVHPALLLLPLAGLPSIWCNGRAERLREAARKQVAWRNRLDVKLFTVATSRHAGKELRLFGLGDELLARFDQARTEADSIEDAAHMRSALLQGVGWLLFGAAFVGALILVSALAAAGRATAGDVVLALTLAGSINYGVSGLAHGVSWLLRSLDMGRRLMWLEDFCAGASTRAAPAEPVAVPDTLTTGIRLEGVSFRYPGTDVGVLANVDLFLPAGSTVAVVGDNGAGKSTLVKLLARFYDPDEGRITVDGVDLRRFAVDEWRLRLSGCFQDFARLELLARHTVGVGDLAKLEEDAAVTAALERAHAGELATGLPDGLDTQLGRSFDGGVEASTGQWQKLALGRAMMRERPLLLLLDEPTASLDPGTEHALLEAYADNPGAITVLVSHRFSTVRMASLIVVVGDGRITEVGSHDALLAAGGNYAELYRLQEQAYR